MIRFNTEEQNLICLYNPGSREGLEIPRDRYDGLIGDLLERPFVIVDILPEQVPADSAGQYFAVEACFLEPGRITQIHRKFADILLKLNCYYDIRVSGDPEEGWEENPDPEKLAAGLQVTGEPWTCYVLVPSEETLLMINDCDTYMTVYNPTERLLDLLLRLDCRLADVARDEAAAVDLD